MPRLILSFVLLFACPVLANVCEDKTAPRPLFNGVVLKIVEQNVRINNGWSHLQKAEIVKSVPGAPFAEGDIIHILWFRTIFRESPKVGDVLEDIAVRRADFYPQFEPKIYYEISDDVSKVPTVESLKQWEAFPARIQEQLLHSDSIYRQKIGFQTVEIEVEDLSDLDENADPKIKPVLTALKSKIEEDVNLEVEDLEQGDYEADGPMRFSVSIVTLKTGDPIAGEVSIRQDAVSGEYWSGHGEFNWKKGKLSSLKLPDYLAYGH